MKLEKLDCVSEVLRLAAIAVRLCVANLGVLTLLLALAPALRGSAATLTWTGGTSGGSATFRTASNWDLNAIPTNVDNAIFGAAGSASTININMQTAAGFVPVGCLTLSPANTLNRTIANSATTTNGVMAFYGVDGILVSNASTRILGFDLASPATTGLGMGLGASGIIHAEGPIYCYWAVSEHGGSHGFTKTGTNLLHLYTANAYSGATTIAEGGIRLATAAATFGTGQGSIHLAGGNLVCGVDRSTVAPIPNPVVLSADSRIYGDGGVAGVGRYIAFSGDFSGSAGKLTIRNQGAAGNTFYVRLTGAFTFTRDIAVGSSSDLPNYAALQLYNSATNGMQTFSGVLSGAGRIERTGDSSSPGGTTVLTGDNTYSGGTVISYGTLLANNPSGSALGSGAVTVTNAGVLGGNGSVGTGAFGTTVSLGGKVSPGANAADVANLSIRDLRLGDRGVYEWQVKTASGGGTPGVDWDLITVSGGWLDGVSSSSTPFIIKVNSLGAAPVGWNQAVAQDWVLIQGGSPGINPTHFSVDLTGFSGSRTGQFSVHANDGSLHLVYTPATDIVVISDHMIGAGTPHRTISWNSVSGRPYHVECKTNLNQGGWLALGSTNASGPATSFTHTNALWPQCFYRVVVGP